MSLRDSYPKIKPALVAFVTKYTAIYEDPPKEPDFPTILGTGFVVREDGLIATNDHVVRSFQRIKTPKDAPKEEWPVIALQLIRTPQGIIELPLEVLGVLRVVKFDGGKHYYGPEKPDLAFVHVKARGLHPVQIDAETDLVEGTEVATAGFPMGTDALTAPGWLHQVNPTLKRGIISAVIPFPCPTPHAFAIDVMSEGGASGSPVFRPDNGKVVGVLHAGLVDFRRSKKGDVFKVPTTISHVVPAHYLRKILDDFAKDPNIKLPPDAITPEEIIAGGTLVDRFSDEPLFRIVPTARSEGRLAIRRFETK